MTVHNFLRRFRTSPAMSADSSVRRMQLIGKKADEAMAVWREGRLIFKDARVAYRDGRETLRPSVFILIARPFPEGPSA